MRTAVTITHLEMTDPAQLRSAHSNRAEWAIVPVTVPLPELNRFLYTAVGGDWYWIDRLSWTYEDWLKYVDRPSLRTWLVTVRGVPAGYFDSSQSFDSGS